MGASTRTYRDASVAVEGRIDIVPRIALVRAAASLGYTLERVSVDPAGASLTVCMTRTSRSLCAYIIPGAGEILVDVAAYYEAGSSSVAGTKIIALAEGYAPIVGGKRVALPGPRGRVVSVNVDDVRPEHIAAAEEVASHIARRVAASHDSIASWARPLARREIVVDRLAGVALWHIGGLEEVGIGYAVRTASYFRIPKSRGGGVAVAAGISIYTIGAAFVLQAVKLPKSGEALGEEHGYLTGVDPPCTTWADPGHAIECLARKSGLTEAVISMVDTAARTRRLDDLLEAGGSGAVYSRLLRGESAWSWNAYTRGAPAALSSLGVITLTLAGEHLDTEMLIDRAENGWGDDFWWP